MSARIPSTSNAAHTSAILQELIITEPDRAQQLAGGDDPLPEGLLLLGVRGQEGVGVAVEGHPPPDHLGAKLRIARRGDLDREPEAVQQLRPQLALLGVHRADQHDPRGVRDRDTLALDGRPPHRRRIEQQVDEMIMEQVDLVDVEDAAVSGGEQPGLIGHVPGSQGLLQVERSDHPVLARTDRQLHQSRRAGWRSAAERAVRRDTTGPARPGHS